jgi:hypothetical protein
MAKAVCFLHPFLVYVYMDGWLMIICERQAIGQICSSNSMAHNLAQCVKLVGQAAGAGAKVRWLLISDEYT